jgi:2-C-methyl-D-erythritol 4-phosphate cytidylyltransferase/2-C-methyl-D-erythritol 2,4-cyclodiphosphate synthase
MYRDNRVIAIIAAAGRGKRLGSSLPKQFLKVRGRTILEMSVEAFEQNKYVDEIFVAANADYCELTEKLCRGFSKLKKIVAGGAERQDSVRAALDCLRGENGIVLVHDAARPFVSEAVINAVIEGTADFDAAIPTVPAKDTIRQVDGTGSRTLQRETLACVQTPQGFRISLLKHAFEKAQAQGVLGTDDASLVERMGINISMVQGEDGNRKITTREDLETEMRIGTGYDVHRLVEGRPLVLCGEQIPYEKGLLGHSDADVALHALMDAMLGAAGLGDIGKHFPDTDERYRGISSMKLLQKTAELLREAGYFLGNADITIIAQRPKIAGYIPKMRANIAEIMNCDENKINIKGTTTEKLGFVGREEGIASEAVCILYRY